LVVKQETTYIEERQSNATASSGEEQIRPLNQQQDFPPNPIQSAISSNIPGWASFFAASSRSLIVKGIVKGGEQGGVERDEHGAEVDGFGMMNREQEGHSRKADGGK
jgi:hypothetical protein